MLHSLGEIVLSRYTPRPIGLHPIRGTSLGGIRDCTLSVHSSSNQIPTHKSPSGINYTLKELGLFQRTNAGAPKPSGGGWHPTLDSNPGRLLPSCATPPTQVLLLFFFRAKGGRGADQQADGPDVEFYRNLPRFCRPRREKSQ